MSCDQYVTLFVLAFLISGRASMRKIINGNIGSDSDLKFGQTDICMDNNKSTG